MGTFYRDDGSEITLHAAEKYPTQKDDLRAMTIAGFRITQNSRQLDLREMRTDVLRFLQSPRALSYWKEKGWIKPKGRTNYVRLTRHGLSVCSGSMHGESSTNTSEGLITLWEKRMIQGDSIANQTKAFMLPLHKT